MTEKEVQVEFIINLLQQGLGRKDILALFSTDWPGATRRVFNSRFSEAYNMTKSPSSVKQPVGLAEQALDNNPVMGRDERMQTLTQIARGHLPLLKPMVCAGIIELVEVSPNWLERTRAIVELNKMEGDEEESSRDRKVQSVNITLPNGTHIKA